LAALSDYQRALRTHAALSETVRVVNSQLRLMGVTMKEFLCLNITEAVAEVEACKAYFAECQKAPVDREQLKLAKAALRSAEAELRAWQEGIVPPLAA
jgi:hypothetical protein